MLKRISVEINAKHLKAFRRRAISYAKLNKEYIEGLSITKDGSRYCINSFHKMKIERAIKDTIDYDQDHVDQLIQDLKQKGHLYGTIHTHIGPRTEATPSLADHIYGSSDKEALLGICHITKSKLGRHRTDIKFWTPQQESEIIQKTPKKGK